MIFSTFIQKYPMASRERAVLFSPLPVQLTIISLMLSNAQGDNSKRR